MTEMELGSLDRLRLEQYAKSLDIALDTCEAERARYQIDNQALRAAFADVEQLIGTGQFARAASLARLIRLDRSNLEDDA